MVLVSTLGCDVVVPIVVKTAEFSKLPLDVVPEIEKVYEVDGDKFVRLYAIVYMFPEPELLVHDDIESLSEDPQFSQAPL